MAKGYNSFSEIDERHRMLKLQREIATESIKLNLSRAKTNLYPTELLGGAKGILQKIVLTFAIKKLSRMSRFLRVFSRRERMELLE